MRIECDIDGVYIYTADLPSSVNGVTVIKNGDYIVFINQNKCPAKQKLALKQELKHISRGHLYSDIKFVGDCENEVQQ